MDLLLQETANLMNNTVSGYEKEISKIRTGRANPNILDNVRVDSYGEMTPLKEVSSIKVPEARQLLVKPYDRNNIKSIVDAITKADLKIQLKVESDGIRLIFPTLTEDVRKSLVKELNRTTEDFRVKVRNQRRDSLQKLKQSEFPEDAVKNKEQEIQKITDKNISIINDIEKNKIQELMQV